jgi:excisionase family DNA binding protein
MQLILLFTQEKLISASVLLIGFNRFFSGLIRQPHYNPTRLVPLEDRFELAECLLTMKERWLSVEEIAAHLGVNRDTIYKWIERKKMPAHKLGRLWKFLASEVDQWIKVGDAAKDVGITTRGAGATRKPEQR